MQPTYAVGSIQANLLSNAIHIALHADPSKEAKKLLNGARREELLRIFAELTGTGHKSRPVLDIGSQLICGEECAEILGVSPRTVNRRRVELGGVPVGKKFYVFDKAFILKKARQGKGR
ncbi:hypothetical protein QQY66_38860 [Streptomyces sp. DG2A-72]|uniref:hypothetical protein n=1 Tax=Streptomyces sp. DG2A-72 TaxID=3051386 RepID=UPI00265BB74A|nr:hypothetical protein [Streptomyces sp. DG2A-72]MDO0937402.1 hypothetical protein [Streptomyces sp. DG2A-72]